MKQRVVPNTISKRFRRKLRRSEEPFLLWLRCKRPHVWARLTRFWRYQFLNLICSIDPMQTPFMSLAPKGDVLALWQLD